MLLLEFIKSERMEDLKGGLNYSNIPASSFISIISKSILQIKVICMENMI
jgi:hypothetical protein